MSVAMIANLPERVTSPEDIDRVYQEFERLANDYVAKRIVFEHRDSWSGPRQFYYRFDVRVVRPEEYAELGRLIGERDIGGGEDARNWKVSPMRAALNWISTAKNVLSQWLKEVKPDPYYVSETRKMAKGAERP